MSREIKTLEGWHQFADKAERGDWDDYCKPGDLVAEEVFDYFLNILPPHRWSGGYLQAGEPYDFRKNPKTGKFESTYTTFEDSGQRESGHKIYRYLGNCFTNGRRDTDTLIRFGSVKEFLKQTYTINVVEVPEKNFHMEVQETRPRAICADGFSISIQAGDALYSEPRENRADGEYSAVELGFPSEREELLIEYAEEPKKPTKTVYPYVPVEVVEQVIEKHGGFFESRMPRA